MLDNIVNLKYYSTKCINDLHFPCEEIIYVSPTEYLGITLDSRLSWKDLTFK